jgi:hypothetical protein
MSKVLTNNVAPVPPAAPTNVVATDVNAKFTAVATATTGINKDNVRSEGIDIRQLPVTSPIMRDARYTYNKWDNGTTNTFTIGTGAGGSLQSNTLNGRAGYALNWGIGASAKVQYDVAPYLVLNKGDLLRIHYSANMYGVRTASAAASFPYDASFDTTNCIIFFPVFWDVAAPRNSDNMQVFPGRCVWWDYGIVDPMSIPQTDPPSISISSEERLLDDGICVYDLAAEELIVGRETKAIRRLHGCLNYVHQSNTPLVIREIGIATTGIMRLIHFTSPGVDTRCFLQASPDQAPIYPLQIKMERMNLGTMVLRKGVR